MGQTQVMQPGPRSAAQIDSWAAQIEQLGVGGLPRIFLVKSVMELQGQQLKLTVAESEQHLDSASLRQKLQRDLSLLLQQPIELDIQYTQQELATPFVIQRRLDQQHYEFTRQSLVQDPFLLQLQQQFAAELDLESIRVLD